MKKSLFILALLAIIVAIGGYFIYSGRSLSESKTEKYALSQVNPITLGWIGPLSGPTQWLGVDGLKTIQLVINEHNAANKTPSFNLLVADIPLHAKGASDAYKEMVKKGAKLFFVLSLEDTKEIAKQAEKDGIIIVNPLNNDRAITNLGSHVFLIGKRTELLFMPIVDLMLKRNERKALVLYSLSERFTATLATDFEGTFKARGGEVIMRPFSAQAVTDFKPILEEGLRNHVDSYVLIGLSEMGLAVKQARAMGIKNNFYLGNYLNTPSTLANLGSALHNLYYVDFTYLDGNVLIAKHFLDQFKVAYQSKPHLEWVALQAYDAANITIQAIMKAIHEKGDLSDNIRKALLKTKDYEGVSGNITIHSDGTVDGIYTGVYQFKNGVPVRLKK